MCENNISADKVLQNDIFIGQPLKNNNLLSDIEMAAIILYSFPNFKCKSCLINLNETSQIRKLKINITDKILTFYVCNACGIRCSKGQYCKKYFCSYKMDEKKKNAGICANCFSLLV